MATYNPYALDPTISNAFSSLSRALIGSADDDAALARARASEAAAQNSLALADANNALAVQRGVQTDRLKTLAALADEKNPALMQSIARSLGLTDATVDGSGNLIKTVKPGDPQMSVPYALDADGKATDMGVGALANAFFGNLEYTPDQFSAGIADLGEESANQLARAMILDPDNSLKTQARAFRSLGHNPGEFFDTDWPETKQMMKDASALAVQNAQNAGLLEVANADNEAEAARLATQLASDEKVEADKIAAENTWRNQVAQKAADANIAVANIVDARERELAENKLTAESQRAASEDVNKQYLSVNGNLIMSPALAERIGLTTKVDINGDKVFGVIAPSPNEEGVVLHLGDSGQTITVSSADLNKIQPISIDGKLVIPDDHIWPTTGSRNPTSRTTDYGNMTEQESKDTSTVVQGQIAGALAALPPNIQIGLHNYIMENINSHMGEEGNDVVSGKREFLNPVVSQGVTNPGVSGSNNVAVPIYFINKWSNAYTKIGSTFSESQFLDAVKKEATELGYNNAEIEKILSIDF